MKNSGALDQIDIRMIESNIRRLGHKGYLDSLLKDMNCIDRIMPNGQHIMQTIGFPYQHIYNKFDYTVDAGLADNKLTGRDANVILGLFSPFRHEIPEYMGYDVVFFKDNIIIAPNL